MPLDPSPSVTGSGRPGAATRGNDVRLLDVRAPEWEALLAEVPHDFYHLPDYVALAAAGERGRPCALYIREPAGTLLVPLIIREVTAGIHDATSPYGYPGPLQTGDGLRTREALQRGLGLLSDAGVVAVFIRLHPLLNAAMTDLPGRLVQHGETVSIDLPASPSQLWHQLRTNHQRDITRAHRLGFSARMDEEWRHLDDFRRLYRETMERRGAAPSYFFDEAYFRELRRVLGERLHLCVVEGDGQVAAAGLFVETSSIVGYHLAGAGRDLLHVQPLKTMIHFVAGWASERGNRIFHLGGGVGGANDSLFHFKAGFSPRRDPFRTLRVVLQPQVYRRLVRAAGGPAPATTSEPAFFPAYRATGARGRDTVAAFHIRQVQASDAESLGRLLAGIDQAHFQPHRMDPDGARKIVGLTGRDVYLIGLTGDTGVAYGMLRGWDEGFETPSLGIGIHRDFEHRGYGRAMMAALHEAARARGARRVRLRVHPQNVRAAALYASLGYRDIGVERGETVMALDL